MRHSLIVENVHAVVTDKNAGGRAVRLRMNILAERAELRQRGGPRLHAILRGLGQGQIGALNLPGVLSRAGQRLREVNG